MLVERSTSDHLGIFASALCAVHCVAGALVAGASGLGPLLADQRIELGFLGVALLLAAVALTSAFRRHHQRIPLVVAGVAIVPLVLAQWVEWSSGRAELMLSIMGAGGLILGHVLNLRALRASGSHCV